MQRFRESMKMKSFVFAFALVVAFFAIGFRAPEVYAAEITIDFVGLGTPTTTTATAATTTAAATTYSLEEAARETRKLLKQRIEEFSVDYISDDGLNNDTFAAYQKMIFEHTGVPDEGDYLRDCVRKCSISATGAYVNGKIVYTISFSCQYLTSLAEEQTIAEKLTQVYQELGLNDQVSRSDYEKALLVYDYITTHVEYDNDHLNDATYLAQYSPYSALINGKAVCHGYALLLYRMLLDQGLDARLVSGYGEKTNLTAEGHAWNIVRIDGNYYFLDSTWDEGGDHEFFLYGTNDPRRHILDDKYTAEDFTSKFPISEITYEEWLAQHPVTGWQQIDGKTYYFNEAGEPVTGKQLIDGKKYYFSSKGVMKTGWLSVGGKYYYFGDDGAMVTGKQEIKGKKYYFSSDGVMQTGWKKSGGKYYYFGDDGAMVTGWKKSGGKYYYFAPNGAMVIGKTVKIGNAYYTFNQKGVCTGKNKV